MELQNFEGKTKILQDFYEKYPHFDYLKFINDNIILNLKNEEDCINYILKNFNDDRLISEIYLQKRKINKYMNIHIGLIIKKELNSMYNFNKYHIYNLTKDDIIKYDDLYNYLIIDIENLQDNINDNYKNKIILYVNQEINNLNNFNNLIKYYNVKFFIINNKIITLDDLLAYIDDYSLIQESNDFDDCFYNIYNYKKKYIEINKNEENIFFYKFNEICDIELQIFISSINSFFDFNINGLFYKRSIKNNLLNKITINLKDISNIIFKYNSNVNQIKIKFRKINEKINQLYLTSNLYKYKNDNRIHQKFNLLDYYDINKPAFFYGIARDDDINTLLNHKGKKYVIFSGGDIDLLFHINKNTPYTKKRWDFLRKIHELDEIYYIPRSEFMINDMKLLNYKYTYIPFFSNTFDNFELKPKGDKIYFYTYPDYQKYLYGNDIIEKIKKEKPEYKFLFLTHNKAYTDNKEFCDKNNIETCFNNDELVKKYQECFIGIRLTNHDGIANSVLEMATLGIKTIYNDGLCPAALTYNSYENIIQHIEEEKKYINQINYELINNVKTYLNIDRRIFISDFYENDTKKIIFSSGDYPYFGGASTNIYGLSKFINNETKNKAICVFNYNTLLEKNKLDPDNTNNCIQIQNFNEQNIKNKMINLLKGIPDIIYTKKWIVGYNLEKIFPYSKVIYLLSSVILSEYSFDEKNNFKNILDNDLIDSNLIPQSIKDITHDKKIIVNSQLSKNILKKFNNLSNINIAYTSLVNNSINDKKYDFIKLDNNITDNWKNRNYDICFVSSNCDRNVKNIKLFISLMSNEKCQNFKKIIIGQESYKYSSQIKNCEFKSLLNHDELIKMLQNVKLIIITSFYESLSNLMVEAIGNNCNILVNNNIGGIEFIINDCIAQDYNDYINKICILTKDKYNCINPYFNYTSNDLLNDLGLIKLE